MRKTVVGNQESGDGKGKTQINLVSVFAKLASVGRTSMKIDVEAWRRTRHDDRSYRVTRATFTFVAIGEDRQPRTVPPMTAASDKRD